MAVQSIIDDGEAQCDILRIVAQRARGHDRPYAVIPKSKSLSEGFMDITYEMLENASNRVAWWLEGLTGGPKPGTIFSWSGANDIRYMVILLAAMKCRYQVLYSSPRNSDDYQKTIFKAAGCQYVCGTKATLAKLRISLEGLSIPFIEGLTLEQVLDPTPVPSYPISFSYQDVKEETPLIIHTSGSTGPPKPIRWSLQSMTTIANSDLFPGPPERKVKGLLQHKRVFCGLPPFHAGGLMICLSWCILCDFTGIWAPSDRPLTHDIATQAIELSGAESAIILPAILEDMSKVPSSLDVLGKVDPVMFGGGPLRESVGDQISQKTRLFSCYGSTEAMIPMLVAADAKDWNYMELDPALGYVFEHVQDDLYHLVIRRVPEFAPVQSVFMLYPDRDEFRTGDLLSPHPTKPNFWTVKGRMDDLIILSSGEKFDPAPGEEVMKKSPLVSNCLLVGRGRPQAILIVERDPEATKDMTNKQVAESLLPTVEEMNKHLATQAHIMPDHIVIAPLGTKFPRTPKGSIRRKATEEMFQTELNLISGFEHENGTEDNHSNGKNGTGQGRQTDVAQAVREAVWSLCRVRDIGDDEDLFEYGLDSIQAQKLSSALRKLSSHWPEDPAAAASIIYSKPTIRGLILAIGSQKGEEHRNGQAELNDLILKYTEDLPSPYADVASKGMTVAITGTTGNLGCHMLNDLIRRPDVSKVICLNRASGREAQNAAYRRFLTEEPPLGDTEVLHYKIDLADPFLGLTPIQYATLQREADLLIHNAWQLDFLRTVKAFEKTHIAGVRHLVDLAAGSPRHTAFVFISSVGAVSGTDPKVFAAVPEVTAGGKILPGGNGYSQSKFVAEKIVEKAAAECLLKTAIVRIGQIAGPIGKVKGTWSTTDWFPRIMASAKVLRAVPDSLGISAQVDWLPINVVSEVVLDIMEATRNKEGGDVDTYHVLNPHCVPWKEMVPGVARYIGKDVQLVSLSDWILKLREAVKMNGTGSIPAEPLLPWLEAINQADGMTTLAVDKTRALSPALASAGPVQLSWIERWMADWGV